MQILALFYILIYNYFYIIQKTYLNFAFLYQLTGKITFLVISIVMTKMKDKFWVVMKTMILVFYSINTSENRKYDQ